MTELFFKTLNMSITASWLVLVVIILRPLLSKAPKWIRGILWSFVALRLVLPFSFESIFSMMPRFDSPSVTIYETKTEAIVLNLPEFNQAVESLTTKPGDSVDPMQILILTLSIVWIIGIIVMLSYMAVTYLLIKNKVKEAVLLKDNVCISDKIATPFILGVIKPKIYLPTSMNQIDTEYVIAHEKAHIKRLDYLWKPFAFLLLCVYWLNPLFWIAYVLFCKDIELACDEKVINDLGTHIKKPYCEALVNCSINRKIISACPLAFGENDVKSRIKSVLTFKKAGIVITALSLSLAIIVAIGFLTDPETEEKPSDDSEISQTQETQNPSFATNNNVVISANSFGFDKGKPYMTITLKNNSDQNVVLYGQDFYILDGDKVVEPNGTVIYEPIASILKPSESDFLTLDLQDYTLKDNKVYRLVKNFKIEGSDKTYGGFIDFKIDSREVKGTLLNCVGTTDDDSYVDNAFGNVPLYLFGDDNVLYSNEYNGKEHIIKHWYPVGKLEKFKVSKKDFRETALVKWHKDSESVESIIANNKTALRYVNDEETFYYKLLQQKDGSYYLIEGWTGNDGIYRVIKMQVATSEPLAVNKVTLTTIPSKSGEEKTEIVDGVSQISKYLKGDNWIEKSEGEWVKFYPSRPSKHYLTVHFANGSYMHINLYFSNKEDTAYASIFRGKGEVVHYSSLSNEDYTRVILSDELRDFILHNILK